MLEFAGGGTIDARLGCGSPGCLQRSDCARCSDHPVRRRDRRRRRAAGGAAYRCCDRARSSCAPAPMERAAVREPFSTGVRVLDGAALPTRCAHRHLGAAGAGNRVCSSDRRRQGSRATVVALIGERAGAPERWCSTHPAHDDRLRDCRPFGGRTRCAARARRRAPPPPAERGLHVLLVLDSLARCRAARDPPHQSGRVAFRHRSPVGRRACRNAEQTRRRITLIATVLTEGAAPDLDPSPGCRAALDGHVVLRHDRPPRWFPAVDLPIASRTLADVADAAAAGCAGWRPWPPSRRPAMPAQGSNPAGPTGPGWRRSRPRRTGARQAPARPPQATGRLTHSRRSCRGADADILLDGPQDCGDPDWLRSPARPRRRS